MKTVSIISPAYNRLELTKAMLASVLAQTFEDWELIVVDDNSTDGIFEYLQETAKSEKRLRVFRKGNAPRGAQTSRNIGLGKATGQYLIFLDSDDILAPFCLEQRVSHLEQNPDLDFAVFPGYKRYTASGVDKIFADKPLSASPTDLFFKARPPWMTLNPIWKRASIVKHQMTWDEKVLRLQDWEFHIKALCHHLKMDYLHDAKPDFYWLFHEEGDRISMQKRGTKVLDSEVALFHKFHTLLKQAGLSTETTQKGITNYLQSLSLRYLDIGEPGLAIERWKSSYQKGITSFAEYHKGQLIFLLYRLKFLKKTPWVYKLGKRWRGRK